ncbi:MAG: cytochrome c-type biogenesis protein CcmH [Gemmatimonadota bacterium]|nr:cytochrome c-type biogenesis protein CcmH [Gemmatimonadota bacterium]
MTRSKTIRLPALVAALALALVMPAAAQSGTSPARTGFDPTRPPGGHYHVGEIGETWLGIEHNVRCNCSCGLDVHSCQFQMQCDTSPGWSQRIIRSLEAGESVDAIQASFVADFGGTVLMSPPVEGFNLVGYFLPAVAIISAGMLIGLIARGGQTRTATTGVRELGEEDAERLRAAMRQLDEAEGPDW